jgi:hypothetical protein
MYYVEDFGLAYYWSWQQALATCWLKNVADSTLTFLETEQSYAA